MLDIFRAADGGAGPKLLVVPNEDDVARLRVQRAEDVRLEDLPRARKSERDVRNGHLSALKMENHNSIVCGVGPVRSRIAVICCCVAR